MKLKCTIGSLSCDGVLAEKGQLFELPDAAAKSVIESGYAIEAQGEEPIDEVVPDEEPKDKADPDEEPNDKEVQDEVPLDEGVLGVSRHDGTKIVKPQKRTKNKVTS